MNPKTLARAGIASAPVTALAPAAGTALTGHGALWLALPLGSVAAAVAGTRVERHAASTRRRGVVVSDPPPADDGIVYAVGPRDEIRIEYSWAEDGA